MSVPEDTIPTLKGQQLEQTTYSVDLEYAHPIGSGSPWATSHVDTLLAVLLQDPGGYAMGGGKLGTLTPFHKAGWDGLSVLDMRCSLAPITSVCLGDTHKPETSTGMGLCVTINLKKVKNTQKPLSRLNLESTRPPVLWITETFPVLMRHWRLG